MNWQVLVLLQALFSALHIIQARGLARAKHGRQAALPVNAVAFTVLYVGGLVVLPVIGNVELSEFLDAWYWYVASALMFNLSFLFLYKASEHLESATVSVLATSSALYTLIIAGIVFNERLTPLQLIGSSILLPCIWYVASLARKQHRLFNIKDFKNTSWLKGLGFILLASLWLSLGHIIEKHIFQTSSVGSYVAFGWLLEMMMAWGLVLAFGWKQRYALENKKVMAGALRMGLLRIGMGLCFIYALTISNNVTLLTVIANFRIIIVAVLAGWLLGERRFYYRKLAAAAVSVVALSIIFWN